MHHIISVLVENEFGVLTRVAALFSGRGYNIQSLTVAETIDPKISLITLVTSGTDATLEQITKQLNKLVNVIRVHDLTGKDAINRILALIKVKLTSQTRAEILKAVELLGGEILDADSECCTIEIHGEEAKIRSAVNMLQTYGIIEFVQTGSVAIPRGKKTVRD